MTFKAGDWVKLVRPNNRDYTGKIGLVKEVLSNTYAFPIRVQFQGDDGYSLVATHEIEQTLAPEDQPVQSLQSAAYEEHVADVQAWLDAPQAVPMPTPRALTTDSAARKDVPMARGLLDYFPDALAEVARLSKAGNDKHNPGEEMHWARDKSTDHADCIMRHLTDRGTIDTDGFLHDAKVAWRALALLQTALEAQR